MKEISYMAIPGVKPLPTIGSCFNNKVIPNVIKKVFEYVADKYRVDIEDARSKSRKRELVTVRQVSAYVLLRYNTKATTTQIGDYLNIDHSTVSTSARRIEGYLHYDKILQKEIDEIVYHFNLEKRYN